MQVVFVHIPKTGGTALREALFAARTQALRLCDYGPASACTSTLVRDARYGPNGSYRRLAALLGPDIPYTLSGHMKAGPLAQAFGADQLVTLLRDPVAHVVSHYRHMRRRRQFEGSLLAFAAQDCARNVQSRYVGQVELPKWLFVGRLDRLAVDASRLSQIIGARLQVQRLNAAPDGAPAALSVFERRRILELNALDAELFESLDPRRFHETDMQSA